VAESCIILSSRSRQPVRKLLYTSNISIVQGSALLSKGTTQTNPNSSRSLLGC